MSSVVSDPHAPSSADGWAYLRRRLAQLASNGHGRGMVILLVRMVRALIDSIRYRRFATEELIAQTWYAIRVCTFPSLAVSIPFGVVLALQVGVLAQQVGATSFAGAGNTVAVIREAAPMIAALMLSGVAGSAICADIGARRIRDELDALEVMGISTVERLVVPRAVAIVSVSVLLTGVVMFFSIITSLLVSVVLLDLSPGTYLASIDTLASMSDLWLSLIKAAVFGLICVTVASHYGLTAKDGPAGVGDAVTTSVVVNFVLLFGANFALSEIALSSTGPLG